MAICLVLGYSLAPWIQTRLQARGRSPLQSVFASSQAPKAETGPPAAIETATIEQLRQMAGKGSAAAENALGLRYFQGDEANGIAQDEKEAFRWFSRAADHGSLPAQTKMAFLYWSGRGVPKDLNRAYFWTVVARSRGDEVNRDLGTLLAGGMTRAQLADIEAQAGSYLRQQTTAKPEAGH
jgi:TPR repeat protein